MASFTEFEYMDWVIIDEKGWRLKKDAPADIEKAFNEYTNSISMDIK